MFKRKASFRKKRRINRRKDSSKGRLKIRDTHVNTRFLDAVFSPAVKIQKKYYGVNSATFHSNMDFDGLSTNADKKKALMAVAGDCVSLQALAGRQIYAEFTMFPQTPITVLDNTDSLISKLDCLSTDIGYMMDQALQFANIQNISNWNFTVSDYSDNNQTKFSEILKTGNYSIKPTYADGGSNDEKKLRQMTFYYEGGSHVHEFTNPTNLPIYCELIEYKPRNLMRHSTSEFNSDATGDITVSRLPGLYESIYLDLCDQKPYDYGNNNPPAGDNGINVAATGTTGVADNTKTDKYFNELDDKGFKMSGKMQLTNMRWKILNKVVVRIDPGQVYKYTVEHKPFKFSPADLMKYNNHYRFHMDTDATSESRFANTIFALNPMFSRGLALRCWGSKSFNLANSTYLQKNSFGLDSGGTVAVNNVQPNSKNDKSTLGVYPISGVATHSPIITHTCVENHKCRMRQKPENNIKIFSNYLPNAGSADDIGISDIQSFMNPLTNNHELLDGDQLN